MQLDDFLASSVMSFFPLVLLLFVQKLCYLCTFNLLFVCRWIAYTFIVQSQDLTFPKNLVSNLLHKNLQHGKNNWVTTYLIPVPFFGS